MCCLQPRLAILALLRCVERDFACHFGIKCSSFCRVNTGTSQRSACGSLGFMEYASVMLGNILLERTLATRGQSSRVGKDSKQETSNKIRGNDYQFMSYCNYVSVTWLYRTSLTNSVQRCCVQHIWFHGYWMFFDVMNHNGPIIGTNLCRRTGLLVLLATARGGAWTVEQPSGSLLEFYPAWRDVMNNVFRIGGPYAVLTLQLLITVWDENT